MNIALFGGTFDPVHKGHLALAQAAQQRFDLKQIHFVPAHVPPLRSGQPLAPFEDRYAMLALATLPEKAFFPSRLEAPGADPAADSGEVLEMPRQRKGATPPHGHMHHAGPGTNYSIDTVRRFRRTLGKSDRLFFLIGIDAFLKIAQWKEPEALLSQAEFIVGSRPGHSLARVAEALPQSIRPRQAVSQAFRKQPAQGELVLDAVHIHFLEDVNVPVSSTQIRAAALSGRSLARFVPEPVAEYIKKMRLYRGGKAAETEAENKVVSR
ncbi:MAG TPA: nicotinate-nicotinamide nucleotide adenylyltransferase [Terriglobales bacterium]|nr:nicotinate-nicotinamide nucleotide adenylyltransferase [Terriglobales bacterium]